SAEPVFEEHVELPHAGPIAAALGRKADALVSAVTHGLSPGDSMSVYRRPVRWRAGSVSDRSLSKPGADAPGSPQADAPGSPQADAPGSPGWWVLLMLVGGCGRGAAPAPVPPPPAPVVEKLAPAEP